MKRGECVTPEIDFAFRGKLVSLLGLPPCGVSPLLFLPQESPSISSARHSGKYSSCIFRMVFRLHGSKTKHRLHGIFEDSSDTHSDWSCTHGIAQEKADGVGGPTPAGGEGRLKSTGVPVSSTPSCGKRAPHPGSGFEALGRAKYLYPKSLSTK